MFLMCAEKLKEIFTYRVGQKGKLVFGKYLCNYSLHVVTLVQHADGKLLAVADVVRLRIEIRIYGKLVRTRRAFNRAHTSPPTLTFDLDLLKFNHLAPCGQGYDRRSLVTIGLELMAPGSCCSKF